MSSTKARIEKAWAARCYDHAGATEVGAWGYECQEQAGLHLNEGEFIFEVIDPENNEPVKEGERGELVVTNLGRAASPVLRYRTGDLVEMTTGACACGRTFARIRGGVLGRSDDMMIVRGVNVFPTQIEELILEMPALAPHYQIVLTREQRLDEMEVLVEAQPGAGEAAANTAGAYLSAHIKSRIGLTASVTVVAAGGVERSQGKARRVIDKRPKA